MIKKIQVLMSTYNGDGYISQQLESLIYQNHTNLDIFIRDDGSKDDTLMKINEYSRPSNIHLLKGENIGVIKSFFELLRLSSNDAGYYALCDQDDVWESNKISRAVEHLEKLPQDRPALYFSRLNLVDKDLHHIGYSRIPSREISFANALVENLATGVTIVFNKAARDLLIGKLPSYTIMHDWWIYLTVCALGNVIYDSEPTVKYRQHGANVVGMKIGFFSQFKQRFGRFIKTGNLQLVTRQAEEFYRIYYDLLDKHNRQVLYRFIHCRKTFLGRLKYAVTCEVYRQTILDNIILRLLILLNRI